MRLIILLCLAAASIQASLAADVSCKDEQGNNVDWWYMYKLPKKYTQDKKGGDTSGQRYLYMTSKSYEKWVLSEKLIGDADSMPGKTLEPLYADEENVLLAAYNDEYPNGTKSGTGGHAKGVVATDGVTGMWLVHSVPKFPSIPEYGYPSSGLTYGQNLLCLTMDAEDLDKVGELLIHNEPHFYYVRNPLPNFNELFPNVNRALNKQKNKVEPFQAQVKVSTADGSQFTMFGKSPKAQAELYADIVAPALGVNLFVEGWRNGVGSLPASCERVKKVFNVQQISNPENSVNFKTTADHSKWAVSKVAKTNWICVGDINRQKSQSKRGGGTVCLNNPVVSDNYRKLVGEFEKCN